MFNMDFDLPNEEKKPKSKRKVKTLPPEDWLDNWAKRAKYGNQEVTIKPDSPEITKPPEQ